MYMGGRSQYHERRQLMNCCRISCLTLSLAASIILGIVAALLRINAIITVTPAFLWTTFGIAVVLLALTFVTSLRTARMEARQCLCSRLSYLLAGLLGTILTSVILLAISFAATSTIGAIFTGLLIFFFSLMICAIACITRCVACSDE